MQVKRIVFALASVAIELCLSAPQQVQQQHQNNEVVAVDNQARNFRTSTPGEYRFEDPSTLGRLGSMLTLGLMGASVALFSSPSNRRALFGPPSFASRRSDLGENYESDYARRVQTFENNVSNGIAKGTRRVGKFASRGVRGGLRRLGLMGRVGARMARKAGRGIKAISRMTSNGLGRFRGSLRRMGNMSTKGFSRLNNRLSENLNDYRNRLRRMRLNASRRLGRTKNNYYRALKRMGSAAGAAGNSVAHYASQGVNRLGVAAQDGAQMAAGVAAGVASVARGVASAAGAVPRSVAAVVQERTVRDCLLQALCYASSPAGIRERRSSSIDSSSSNPTTKSLNNNNINNDDNNKIMARAILDYDSSAFRVDDCEVFECRVASAGRHAYDFVRRMGLPNQNQEQENKNIKPPLLT